MSESPRSLLSLLTLRPVGEDRWWAPTPAEGPPRLFGGQVAAQSLMAACLSVELGPRPHSLHGYFIRPGRPDTDMELVVERTRDGRSFTTRHVTAVQEGQAIFELTASFHTDEDGVDWQEPGPEMLAPPAGEDGPEDSPFGFFRATMPFDVRPAAGIGPGFSLHPCWVRLREEIDPDDQRLHACALAFVSDLAVVSAARAPGSRTGLPSGASLDHAVWFHRPVDVRDWMLFSADAVSNFGARGLARGTFLTRGGALVASMAQEALLRTSGRFQVPPGMGGLRPES